MTPTVEQLCDLMAERQLIASADLSRLRARWFRLDRKDAADVDKFGHWLAVNGYLTSFRFRLLRNGKVSLLRLNQYQIVDHVTSGPFAGAYLATDPVHRRVVVEVLAAERAASPDAVRAFQAAAEQAMTVRHPNVGLTLDFGEAQGRHYLVREFDEGETLAAFLSRRGKLQHLAATRLFALALLGLQALHDKHVPAGPLSPECLLLAVAGKSASGKARVVKILNAGVSRTLFDPAALDDAIMTTAAADSPTSAVKAHASPQDDLFRLGAAFYRRLTGFASLSPGFRRTGVLSRHAHPPAGAGGPRDARSSCGVDARFRPRAAAEFGVPSRQEFARVPGQRGRGPTKHAGGAARAAEPRARLDGAARNNG